MHHVKQLDELNVTGKTCTSIDFTGGGKCDGSVKFEDKNTYGRSTFKRPNFILRITPSEDGKEKAQEKQFMKPGHVQEILRYLQHENGEPEITGKELAKHPTRKVKFIEKSTLPESADATAWYVEFDGPFDNYNPKHGRRPHVMIQKEHVTPEVGKIYELTELQKLGNAYAWMVEGLGVDWKGRKPHMTVYHTWMM